MNHDLPDTVLRLIEEIAPDVDARALDPDADVRREADLDSLDFQTLIELVARDTGVVIPEADYRDVRSINGLVAYLSRTSPH